MQQTSAVYQREMSQIERDRSYIRIKFGVTDLDAAPTSSLKDNGHDFYSRLDMIVFSTGIPERTYATCEKNRMKADGRQLIASPTNPLPQGYVSDVLSGEDCVFIKTPYIHIDFSKKHACPALTFTFDVTTGEFPADMDVIVYRDGKILETVSAQPDSSTYILWHEFTDFDGLRIIFKKTTVQYHRARLQNIIFGAGIIFENDVVSSTRQVMEVDPIMRNLEENTFDFSIINEDGMYNPDSPSKIWEYLQEQQPIEVEYGQQIKSGVTWEDVYTYDWSQMELTNWKAIFEGGFVEWLNGGRYILNGEPENHGLLASFQGRSRLMSLTNPYHKGAYNPAGKTLYDHAVELLEETDIPEVFPGQKPYVVSDVLKTVRTTAPIPKTSYREALQLIAHAGCCISHTDRNGIVRIEPISMIQHDMAVDFASMFDWPDVTKIAPLYGVRVNVYSYTPGEVRELHKQTYDPGSYLVEIDHATNVVVTGATSYTVMGGTIQITVAKRGEVIISGRALEVSTSSVLTTTGHTGEVELIENPLVTDRAAALKLAEYVKGYLEYRNTYEFSHRGFPEIDPTDIIYSQSRFAKSFAARILRTEVEFNGAVEGHIIEKGMLK